jgi:hypothetical protein
MKDQDLLRVGLLLLGVWAIVHALGNIGSSLGQGVLDMGIEGFKVINILHGEALFLSFHAVYALVFGVLPGWFVLSRASRWSRAWCPGNDHTFDLKADTLLPVGAILLGIWLIMENAPFVIVGLLSIVGSTFIESSREVSQHTLQPLASSLIGTVRVHG